MSIPTVENLFYACCWLTTLCLLIVIALAALGLVVYMVSCGYMALRLTLIEIKNRIENSNK